MMLTKSLASLVHQNLKDVIDVIQMPLNVVSVFLALI